MIIGTKQIALGIFGLLCIIGGIAYKYHVSMKLLPAPIGYHWSETKLFDRLTISNHHQLIDNETKKDIGSFVDTHFYIRNNYCGYSSGEKSDTKEAQQELIMCANYITSSKYPQDMEYSNGTNYQISSDALFNFNNDGSLASINGVPNKNIKEQKPTSYSINDVVINGPFTITIENGINTSCSKITIDRNGKYHVKMDCDVKIQMCIDSDKGFHCNVTVSNSGLTKDSAGKGNWKFKGDKIKR